LARKLANTARVKVRVGVDVRRENQSWTTWIEEREPEESKRESGVYPAIVMSSAKRHAVWKRKMESREKRRMEKEAQ